MSLPEHADLPHHLIERMELCDTDDVCVVCQEACTDPVQTICEHIYCRECLTIWCDGHNTCPSCRTPLFTYSSIPARRLITIPEDFFDILPFEVFDHDEVQEALEYYHENEVRDDNVRLYADDDIEVSVDSWEIQPVLVGAGIWFFNKVEEDYGPHLRETFKGDWVSVIFSLDQVLRQHEQWAGTVSELRERLMGAVIPSTEEPRRAPMDVWSWDSIEEGEAWVGEFGRFWVGDGWPKHVDQIKDLVEYVIRRLVGFSGGDEEDEGEGEEDADGEC